MERVDLLVIGGGPSGAIAARTAAEAGARVLLVERGRPGVRPPACTGLVSPRTLPALRASGASVVREIHAVRVHAPGGATADLRAVDVKAFVLDRTRLDAELLETARSAGAEVRTENEAVGFDGRRVTIRCGGEEGVVLPTVIIGADGPGSAVATWCGLDPPPRTVGMQAVVDSPIESPDRVDVYVGEDVAPGFFAWGVPAEDGRLRVGILADPDAGAADLLERLLRERFPGRTVVERTAGAVPAAPATRTTSGQVILVGDAAGQVKPISGGGLYTGGVCARIAGEIAAIAARSARDAPRELARYEARWREEIGEELRFGVAARRAMRSFSDADIDDATALLSDPELAAHLAAAADIDRPSRLVGDLLRRRALWPRLLPILYRFVGDARVPPTVGRSSPPLL